MSRVIAAYDLDEDHGRLWVNADLKRMPEVVIVANQPMDRAQTVTYVPEARLLEAFDENKRVEAENAKLRELCASLWRRASLTMPPDMKQSRRDHMAALGICVE